MLPLSERNSPYSTWEVIFSNPSKRKIFRIFSGYLNFFPITHSHNIVRAFSFFPLFLFRKVHLVPTQMMAVNFYRTPGIFLNQLTVKGPKCTTSFLRIKRPYKLTRGDTLLMVCVFWQLSFPEEPC